MYTQTYRTIHSLRWPSIHKYKYIRTQKDHYTRVCAVVSRCDTTEMRIFVFVINIITSVMQQRIYIYIDISMTKRVLSYMLRQYFRILPYINETNNVYINSVNRARYINLR